MGVIRKNILWLLMSQAATWLATLVTLVIVPNSLGSADFGSFAYAYGYVGFFTLAAGLGTGAYISRAIARDYGLIGPYVWNAILLKVALWGLLAPAALLLAYGIGNRGLTLLLVAINCGGMLPYLLTEVMTSALGGMQRMARPAMWIVTQIYFQTFFGILVLALGGGVVAYALVSAFAPLIPTIAIGLMVRPFIRGHRAFDARLCRLLVVGGAPLLALAFLNLIYGGLDTPILHAVVGSEPVAWYTVASRWVGIPLFITTAVCAASFPSFSLHGNPLTSEFAPRVNRAVHVVLFVTIPAAVGLMLTANDLVHFIYGSEYDSSIVLIQILAVGLPIISLDTVLATALVASNRIRGYLVVAAIAAVVNPIACVVLVNITNDRYGNGALGTAILTVGIELWVMAGAMHFRSPGVVDRYELRRIGKILVASAAMAPFLLLSERWPLGVQVAIGLLVYSVASLMIGSITVSELRDEMSQMIRSRRSAESLIPPKGGVVPPTGLAVEDAISQGMASTSPPGEPRPS